jgi:hypothetical protein
MDLGYALAAVGTASCVKPQRPMEVSMKAYLVTAAAAAAALIGFSFAPTQVSAASGSERECTEMGGTYIKDGSNSRCELPPVTTKPGNNPPGEQGSEKTTETTLEGQGNLNNKQETSTTCSGNPGQCKNQ